MTQIVVSLIGGISLGATYALIALGIVLAYRATATFNFAQGELMLLPAYIVGAWQAQPRRLAGRSRGGRPGDRGGYRRRLLRAGPSAHHWPASLYGHHCHAGIGGRARRRDAVDLRVPGVHHPCIVLAPGRGDYRRGSVQRHHPHPHGLHAYPVAGIAAALRFTNTGRRLRAAGQDPVLASQGGINVRRYYTWSWALAAILAGLAGVVYGSTNVVDFSLTNVALVAFPAIIIGGLDSIEGAVIGGLMIGIFQGFVATYLGSQLLDVLTYALLLVVMLTFPRGLFGTKQVARV